MNKILKISLGINTVLILIGIVLLVDYKNFTTRALNNEKKIIQIESGDTFMSLQNKVPSINGLWLKIYLKQNPPDFGLQVGSYEVPKESNIESVIQSLKKPIIEQIKLTLLEGWNIYDIDEYLLRSGLIDKKNDYVEYISSTSKIKQLTDFFPFIKGVPSLEGFLYPDTYLVKADFKINEFVIQQLENFEKKVFIPLLEKQQYSQSTLYDVIILASIVEKEEKNPQNKSTVAGILKKRLNEGWMLGADITVCYPYKLTSEECKLVVSKYIREKNDYNTRTKYGLPKTPIGNPSYETIYATVYDTKTPYYYYLHDTTTGQIYYGKTNADHEKNKSLYIK